MKAPVVIIALVGWVILWQLFNLAMANLIIDFNTRQVVGGVSTMFAAGFSFIMYDLEK